MKRGDKVNVVDERLDGSLYYEGRAKVLRCISPDRNLYRVEFDDGRRVTRRLYPQAQKRLMSFIRKMNQSMQAVAVS